MTHSIESDRLLRIASDYEKLDPLQAYYRKRSIRSSTTSPFPCWARDIVTASLRGASKALDVGCGDGEALLGSASDFESGVGIDDSEYVIAVAKNRAAEANVSNVEFEVAQAVSLPFDDDEFEVVFTERGPLGHADITLVEALRVLRSGGRILIETMGSCHTREYSITNGRTDEGTLLTSIEIERDRLQRHGVEPELLLSNLYRIRYETIYDWFESYCSVQRYLERDLPDADSIGGPIDLIDSIVADDGTVSVTHHQIVAGGTKL